MEAANQGISHWLATLNDRFNAGHDSPFDVQRFERLLGQPPLVLGT